MRAKVAAPLVLALSLVACSPNDDDDAATTTAVCADSAELEPLAFDAVTRTRNVRPTSAPTTTYDDPVAPTLTQPAPPPSQRNHAYAYDVGLPDHPPLDAVNVAPSCATPDTTGNDEFTGADVVVVLGMPSQPVWLVAVKVCRAATVSALLAAS